MADLAVTCSTADEGILIDMHPASADGKDAVPEGPIVITKDSGDGDWRQNSTTPLEFEVVAGIAAGDSVFSVRGHSKGAPDVVEKVTLSVTLAAPPLTTFNLTAGAIVPKP